MITYLHGTLTKKSPTEIIVDIHGLGYSVHISLSTYELLPELQSDVHILTYHHIREDAQILYGFMQENEREMFRLLIGVSGIGPKMAQTILSGIRPSELVSTISAGAIASLQAIPGVGKKTAERMIVELRDKIAKMDGAGTSSGLPAPLRSEALTALVSLGLPREKAEQSIRNILNEHHGESLSVEELIKLSLKHSGK
jgi:Holliday junction DNA helicase RuvA